MDGRKSQMPSGQIPNKAEVRMIDSRLPGFLLKNDWSGLRKKP
jgi:hypothetical protein